MRHSTATRADRRGPRALLTGRAGIAASTAAITVLAVAAIVASLAAASPPRTVTPSDEAAITAAVREAIDADQTAFVPDPGARGRALRADEATALKGRMHQRLTNVFSGALLQTRLQQFDRVVDGETGGTSRVLGGGEDYVNVTNIAVNGTTASAKAEAKLWTRIAQDQAGHLVPAEPHQIVLFSFGLSLVNGRWLVTTMNFDFAPGNGP